MSPAGVERRAGRRARPAPRSAARAPRTRAPARDGARESTGRWTGAGRGRGEPRHRERGRRHPPAADRPAVYISCGTWSLVGCELAAPVTTPEALAANVTNELGVDGTVRLLKNVTGLWLLEECRRAWARRDARPPPRSLPPPLRTFPAGAASSIPTIRGSLRRAKCRTDRRGVPGDRAARAASPGRVRRGRSSTRLPWRGGRRSTIERVAGFDADVVHLVGGGSSIPLLRRAVCQRVRAAGARGTGRGDGRRQRARASDRHRCVADVARPPARRARPGRRRGEPTRRRSTGTRSPNGSTDGAPCPLRSPVGCV